MVKHVVMWTFKAEVDKDTAFAKMQEIFAQMKPQVPGLLELELFKGFQGYDACLITAHTAKEDLAVYQDHPAHKTVKEYMHSIIDKRASCDAEY